MACCPADAGPPIVHDYTPVGKRETIGDVPVYIAGDMSSPKCIIAIPDIFGFDYTQVFQVADMLAATSGTSVIVIDPFRGDTWKDHTFSNMDELNAFFAKFTWEKVTVDVKEVIKHAKSKVNAFFAKFCWEKVSVEVKAVIEHAKSKGATTFASVGFCWGVYIAFKMAIEGMVIASGGAHPSFLGQEVELAKAMEKPVCLIPAKGDAMEAVKEIMDEKPVASKCVYKRMDDQTHGFCAARADWTKPEIATASGGSFQITTIFKVLSKFSQMALDSAKRKVIDANTNLFLSIFGNTGTVFVTFSYKM
eukprot:gene8678-34124_t